MPLTVQGYSIIIVVVMMDEKKEREGKERERGTRPLLSQSFNHSTNGHKMGRGTKREREKKKETSIESH